ncbi:MAG: hypothetical protein A4E25_00025 [Methanobacterium sp. PtaB.Bin024]|nr:MAG: hypothetical protein A4E25_00025 [Methanobacterium sp. PtaB.Bin024]
MTTTKTLTEKIRNQIKKELIYGYINENGIKIYPTVKEAAEWHKVSYDALRRHAGKWKWKAKRESHQARVAQKVKEKDECEADVEDILLNDVEFSNVAVKLRNAADAELSDILGGKPVKSVGYQLMNIGKALESAQKVSKTAVGEPSEITTFTSKQEIKKTVDVFGRVDKLIQFIDRGNYNNADRTVQPQDTDKP